MSPVRIGLKCAQQNMTTGVLREVWQIADDAGFDHCWIFDHLAAAGPAPEAPVFEAWTLIGAMAEVTRRIRIGVMVTSNTYRHPGVLAKAAVTADHLCDGRLEMGIGAGWAENEHTMLGIEFGTARERIDRLGEACQVMRLLWTQPRADFEGRYYRLEHAVAEPKPRQRPHPPVWIGGAGERRTLRVVAEQADAWNVPGRRAISPGTITPEEAGRLSRVLDGHCEAAGRDPAALRRSVQFRFEGDLDGTAALAEEYLRQGFTEFIVMVGGDDPRASAEDAASGLLPRLRELAG
jgi:F420-dependent oxidoreductase-like protein